MNWRAIYALAVCSWAVLLSALGITNPRGAGIFLLGCGFWVGVESFLRWRKIE